MTAAPWPAWIATGPLEDGYGETPQTNRAEFQPEVGEPIRRRRTTLKQDTIPFLSWFSSEDVDDIQFFHRTTLGEGSLPFTLDHPRTGVEATWMFVEPPRLVRAFGDSFQIQFSLRLLSGGVVLPRLDFSRPRNSMYLGII